MMTKCDFIMLRGSCFSEKCSLTIELAIAITESNHNQSYPKNCNAPVREDFLKTVTSVLNDIQ